MTLGPRAAATLGTPTPTPMRTLLLTMLLAAPALAQSDVDALADALSLTDDQADLVAEVYDARDPGSVWTLAAELSPTLSDAQRDALFARPERPEGGTRRGGRGMRGEGMRGRGQRGDRERDPAQAAARRAARDAALGLDAQASADLDAALDELDRRALMQALRDGDLPEAIADVLTDEQAELYRTQMALAGHLRRAARQGRIGL